MNLSTRIRTLRSEQHLSQGKLAQALGVSRQAVSKWENGTSVPDMENLIQLCEIFDVDLAYLTTGEIKPAQEAPPPPQTSAPAQPIVVNLVEKEARVIEKPVIRKVVRIKYLRNPIEFSLVALAAFLLGFLIGKLF